MLDVLAMPDTTLPPAASPSPIDPVAVTIFMERSVYESIQRQAWEFRSTAEIAIARHAEGLLESGDQIMAWACGWGDPEPLDEAAKKRVLEAMGAEPTGDEWKDA